MYFALKIHFPCQFIIQEGYLNIIKSKKYHKSIIKKKLSNLIIITHKYIPFKPNIHENSELKVIHLCVINIDGAQTKWID